MKAVDKMIKWEKIKKLLFPREEIQTKRPEFREEIRAVSAGNIQDYEQQVNELLETGKYRLATVGHHYQPMMDTGIFHATSEIWYAILIRTRWEEK